MRRLPSWRPIAAPRTLHAWRSAPSGLARRNWPLKQTAQRRPARLCGERPDFGAATIHQKIGRAQRHRSISTLTAIPQRRPVFDKLRTSALKRHVRLVRWIARMRGHYKTPLTRRYFGADFVVMPNEAIDEEIAIKRYEWWELNMMVMACRRYRPEAFIDVGANTGLYTCVLGKAQAARKLLAFEPDPRNFARLSESIARAWLVSLTRIPSP